MGDIAKKSQQRRLKLYRRVMQIEDHCVGRRAMEIEVQGRKMRRRPKRRWLDRVRGAIKEKGMSGRVYTTLLHGGVYRQTS